MGHNQGYLIFYKVIVQAVLFFRLEMWVLTPCMDQAMGSFHHRGVQQITLRKPMSQEEGGWEYSMLATAMGEAGFEEIRVYIKRSQNTVAQYIVTQPILDLCE